MNTNKSSDFLWKIVLAGDSYVGKTTLRKRAMGEHFAEEYISTVGADFSSLKLKVGELTIGYQIWDLAGQDKYKYIRSSFYGGATGCFLVFDTTNSKSLQSLSIWVDEAIRYSNGTIDIFIICGNKIDLKNKREIPRETGERFVQALRESSGLNCQYIETSALTGENIDIAFDYMAKSLLEREGITPIKPKDEITIQPFDDLEEEIQQKPLQKPFEKEELLQPQRKSVLIDDDDEETELLIAEVMNVLDETNEVIIGREVTDNGERAITVPKNSIKKEIIDEEPKITPELERVLHSINIKLDSLTTRLKDLEEEITNVKIDNIHFAEEEKIEESLKEDISDLRDELDILALERPDLVEKPEEEDEIIFEDQEEITDDSEVVTTEESPTLDEGGTKADIDEQLDKDQKVLESILSIEESLPDSKDTRKDELIEDINEKITDYSDEEKITDNIHQLEELVDLPDEELIDIPNNESLEPLEEEHVPTRDDSVIGTELSSAMISELKGMSQEESLKSSDEIPQPLKVEDEKKKCPICGEPTKLIRQYNKYYCAKCGRYLI